MPYYLKMKIFPRVQYNERLSNYSMILEKTKRLISKLTEYKSKGKNRTKSITVAAPHEGGFLDQRERTLDQGRLEDYTAQKAQTKESGEAGKTGISSLSYR